MEAPYVDHVHSTDMKALTDHYRTVEDTADPEAVYETHHEVQRLLDTAADIAHDDLAEIGVAPESVSVRFRPWTYGAEYDEDTGAIIVGQFTQADRFTPYMCVGHEMIHQYFAEERNVAATNKNIYQEEALSKLWDLHCLDALDDRERAEEILAFDEQLYNDHDGVYDNFGTRMATQARRFLDWLEQDFDGAPSDGIGPLIHYVDEFYLSEDDWSNSLKEHKES